MGGAVAWACALCVASLAVAAPARSENRLVPDSAPQVDVSARPVAPSASESKSLKRMMRYGVTLEEMQKLHAAPQQFHFGVPYDELAIRDDRVNLLPSGRLSAGTILRIQRDFTRFRETAGVRFFKPEAVPGLMLSPFNSLPIEIGAGGVVSLDEFAANSLLASRAFFATLQLGLVF
jgi:hypothetical protein